MSNYMVEYLREKYDCNGSVVINVEANSEAEAMAIVKTMIGEKGVVLHARKDNE